MIQSLQVFQRVSTDSIACIHGVTPCMQANVGILPDSVAESGKSKRAISFCSGAIAEVVGRTDNF